MGHGLPPDPRKERFWRQHLRRWHRSGLSIRAYCQEHHLAEPSFYHWRRTLQHRDAAQAARAQAAAAAVTFLPVHLQPEPTPAPRDLRFPDGRVLRLPADYAPDRLRALLAAREEPPC
jgi:hypothetical protein